MEGDATRIEDEYIARLSDADKAEYDAEMAAQRERFGGETADVPEILLFQLGAPYTYGPYTVRVLLANGGNAAVDAALTGPTPSARMFLEPAETRGGNRGRAHRSPGVRGARSADELHRVRRVRHARGSARMRTPRSAPPTRSVAGSTSPTRPPVVRTAYRRHSRRAAWPAARTLVSALQGWAATMPGAVVADVGDAVRVTSCDPGAQTTAPDDALIQRSEQLLALRGEPPRAWPRTMLAAATARSAARLVASRPDLYEIFFLDQLTPEQQQTLGEAAAFSTSACQANPASGLSG